MRLVLLAAALLVGLTPMRSEAQRERPGILRGILDEFAPGSAEELDAQARGTQDGDEARRLYSTLQARHADRPEGVRAALWMGFWSYSGGDFEAALEMFERARRHARDPEMKARAEFWCEQVRHMLGGEPLTESQATGGEGFYAVLRRLVHADRSIRAGRRSDAEATLLALEGDSRRTGLLSLVAVRWNDALALAGGRVARDPILPLLASLDGLPEQVYLAPAAAMASEQGQPAIEPEGGDRVWTLEFGVYLRDEDAQLEADRLGRAGYEARVDSVIEDGRRRLHLRLGAFPSRAEAESLAARIPPELAAPPWIVQVR